MKKLLALDFGGTSIKYGIVDENASISMQDEVPAPVNDLDAIVTIVNDLYARFKDEICGIAVSLPGTMETETGFIRVAGAYSNVLAGKNFYSLFENINVPISIENDGKAAALAEQWKGSLKDVTNGAVVVVGTGLGGGIIIDGKLQKGPHLTFGEISLLLSAAGDYEISRIAGFAASTTGLLNAVAAKRGMDPSAFELSQFVAENSETTEKKYNGKDVFRWIEEGEENTVAAYQEWLKKLAMVIYNLSITIDAEVIAVGGGISRNPRLVADLEKELEPINQTLMAFGIGGVNLCRCTYSADANLIGAVYNWLAHHA